MSSAKAAPFKDHSREERKYSKSGTGIDVGLKAALFLSGIAALIYQVVWIRQLTLVVGVEVYSITVAVSAFFAGLALGSGVLGRLADRCSRPLQLYAYLEIGVGVLGVAATAALAHAAVFFVAVESRGGLLAWCIPFLLVSVPAFLIGGTLPVAMHSLVRGDDTIARTGGLVYAANTAGGIVGALISTFVLLPHLGVIGTGLAAALFNLFAAALAFVIDRQMRDVGAEKDALSSRPIQSRTALLLYAIAGGIALGYEVVWSQAMGQFVSTRVFAFSVVLATYLAGLVIGSALYARFGDRVRDRWGAFAVLICAAGFIALLEIAGLDLWQLQVQDAVGRFAFSVTGSELARMCAQFFVAALGVVFVPTVLLGAAFPVALNLTTDAGHAGRGAGAVLAVNTAGGIVGTLLTGFVLVPAFGIVRTLAMLAVSAVTVGVLAILLGPGRNRGLQLTTFGLGAVVIAMGVVTPADRLSRLLLTTRGGGGLVFYQEGRGATVAVAQQRSGDNVFRRLFIQGVSNSGDAMPSLRYMRLQAALPLLIHRGEPKSVMVIGFGTGITSGATLRYSPLERRVCVELLPAVVQAGELFPENYKAGSDSHMQVRISDGRHELLRSSERYDVITLEPPPPSAEGVVNLYSTDFYRLASTRLERNGLFAQWLPISTQNDGDTRSLVRSFLDAFPYATMWTTEMHEMLLVGSHEPIEVNAAEISKRFAQPDFERMLQGVGVSSPAALLATWVTGRDGLERYAAGARPVTDNDPRIEYAPWVRSKEITRVLPELLALGSELPVVNADSALRMDITRERQNLMDFYSAGLAAYNGDREQWQQAISRVLTADRENRYYRWIIGESRRGGSTSDNE